MSEFSADDILEVTHEVSVQLVSEPTCDLTAVDVPPTYEIGPGLAIMTEIRDCCWDIQFWALTTYAPTYSRGVTHAQPLLGPCEMSVQGYCTM